MDITKYLINTAPRSHFKELGIFKFAKDFFPKRFNNEFAEIHYDIVQAFFELYAPYRRSREDRKGYSVVHREAAKSSIINFLIPMYIVYTKDMPWYLRTNKGTTHQIVNDEKFIIVASETAQGAERFSMDMRSTINKRGDLAAIFGEKSPRELTLADDDRKGDQPWRRSAFVTTDDLAIVAVGSGQQIRGIQINGCRPTTVIMDDMYSLKNVVTDLGRNKVRAYIDSELIFSADTLAGKIFLANSIVHRDTHAYEVTKSKLWTGIERPIIDKDDLERIVATLKKDENGHYILPSFEECMEIEKNVKSLSWKERHNLMIVLQRYQEFHSKGQIGVFYREYLNITRSPDQEKITEDQIAMVNFDFDNGTCYFEYEGFKWRCAPKWQVGIDLATPEAKVPDDAAITVSAHVQCVADMTGTNNMKYKTFCITCHVEGGQYKTIPNKQNPSEKNFVTALINIYKKVKNLDYVIIEQNGQQGAVINAIRQGLEDREYYLPIRGQVSSGEKIGRIRAELEVWVGAHNKILLPSGGEGIILKNQVLFLGETAKVDYADSLHMSVRGLSIRPQPSQFLQARLDELSRSPHKQEVPDWITV